LDYICLINKNFIRKNLFKNNTMDNDDAIPIEELEPLVGVILQEQNERVRECEENGHVDPHQITNPNASYREGSLIWYMCGYCGQTHSRPLTSEELQIVHDQKTASISIP